MPLTNNPDSPDVGKTPYRVAKNEEIRGILGSFKAESSIKLNQCEENLKKKEPIIIL